MHRLYAQDFPLSSMLIKILMKKIYYPLYTDMPLNINLQS